VLIKELQSLGMDVKILSGDEEEIEMRDLEDDEETKKADGLALSNDEDAADLAPVDLERDAVTKE
jgi:DNA-directed RNA polymerase subunit beta